jgi:NADH:ubiquinone oxidoreductase subunit 6 (subunit J)
MIHLADPTLHAMLIASAVGAIAVVIRVVMMRTAGRSRASEALGCVGLLAIMAVVALAVFG